MEKIYRCPLCGQRLAENQKTCPICKKETTPTEDTNTDIKLYIAPPRSPEVSKKIARKTAAPLPYILICVVVVVLLFLPRIKTFSPSLGNEIIYSEGTQNMAPHLKEPPTDSIEKEGNNYDFRISQVFFGTKNDSRTEKMLVSCLDNLELNHSDITYTEKGYYTADLLDQKVVDTKEEVETLVNELQDKLKAEISKQGFNSTINIHIVYWYKHRYR